MQALEIKGLRKVYPNGTVALQNSDLSVQSGDFFGLLGHNGAGKSTKIGIIHSLIKKTAGTVKVFGFDIDTHPIEAKLCMGLVPQEPNFDIFETVINILVDQPQYYGIPKADAQERAHNILEKLQLQKQRDTICMRLSGGMKRRLMIARALVPLLGPDKQLSGERKLLILDEPTAGVDIELRYMIWEFLKELNETGTTIVLTTHYLEEAEALCKNIAIMDQGQVIDNTSVKELSNRIGSHTLICDLTHPITHIPETKEFSIRLMHAKQIEIDLQPTQTVSQLFAYLQQHAIEVTSISNKTNRLETFFLNSIHRS